LANVDVGEFRGGHFSHLLNRATRSCERRNAATSESEASSAYVMPDGHSHHDEEKGREVHARGRLSDRSIEEKKSGGAPPKTLLKPGILTDVGFFPFLVSFFRKKHERSTDHPQSGNQSQRWCPPAGPSGPEAGWGLTLSPPNRQNVNPHSRCHATHHHPPCTMRSKIPNSPLYP